jgi:proline dehydrogenase
VRILNEPARRLLLAASESRFLRRTAPRLPLARRAVRRFMPGEELDDALGALYDLEAGGAATVLTYLGENVADEEGVEAVIREYRGALEQTRRRGLGTELSVKPTQLGMEQSLDRCIRSLEVLAEEVARGRGVLWVDMEASPYVDDTLAAYRVLRGRGAPLGICLQSYLHRTPKDLESLLELDPAIRLVKGAYREPESLALTDGAEVDRQFLELGERLLEARAEGRRVRVALATHDDRLIRELDVRARGLGLSPLDYEFQMLYGIRPDEQRRLMDAGGTLGVLVSYGEAWFPWYMRRLAERPANLFFVLGALWSTGHTPDSDGPEDPEAGDSRPMTEPPHIDSPNGEPNGQLPRTSQ